MRFDCTSAYGLHVGPRRGAPKAAWSAQGVKKNIQCPGAFFFSSKNMQSTPWRTMGAPICLLIIRMHPKSHQNATKSSKIHEKVIPKDRTRQESNAKGTSGTLARRTARSA